MWWRMVPMSQVCEGVTGVTRVWRARHVTGDCASPQTMFDDTNLRLSWRMTLAVSHLVRFALFQHVTMCDISHNRFATNIWEFNPGYTEEKMKILRTQTTSTSILPRTWNPRMMMSPKFTSTPEKNIQHMQSTCNLMIWMFFHNMTEWMGVQR